MNARTCPSCHTRLSPLAVECPECGIALSVRGPQRPFLFQASGLQGRPLEESPAARPALRAPALGRVATVQVEADPADVARLTPDPQPPADDEAVRPQPKPALAGPSAALTLWPLVALEAAEAALLAALTLGALALVAAQVGTTLGLLITRAWLLVIPFVLVLCWTTVMVPLVLASQSPLMPFLGLVVAEDQMLRRLNYSLLHLVSVACFPLSFLCLVLSPRHQSLGELLSGVEIISQPVARLR
ncbi:MAG TPA: hypothetical protein VJ505_02495 [Holophagaceae bacterium]|nr:hypothetical protein [Holophagaceae bacterium]